MLKNIQKSIKEQNKYTKFPYGGLVEVQYGNRYCNIPNSYASHPKLLDISYYKQKPGLRSFILLALSSFS